MTKMPLINLKMTEMPLFILQNDKNATVLARFYQDY
jgi:hypothetical protein